MPEPLPGPITYLASMALPEAANRKNLPEGTLGRSSPLVSVPPLMRAPTIPFPIPLRATMGGARTLSRARMKPRRPASKAVLSAFALGARCAPPFPPPTRHTVWCSGSGLPSRQQRLFAPLLYLQKPAILHLLLASRPMSRLPKPHRHRRPQPPCRSRRTKPPGQKWTLRQAGLPTHAGDLLCSISPYMAECGPVTHTLTWPRRWPSAMTVSPLGLEAKRTWGTQLLLLTRRLTPCAITDPTLQARMSIPEPLILGSGHPQAQVLGHRVPLLQSGVTL